LRGALSAAFPITAPEATGGLGVATSAPFCATLAVMSLVFLARFPVFVSSRFEFTVQAPWRIYPR